jgi:hypothetical protein
MNHVVVEYDHFVGAVAKITLLRWMAYLKTEPWVDARQRAQLEKPVLPFLSNFSDRNSSFPVNKYLNDM